MRQQRPPALRRFLRTRCACATTLTSGSVTRHLFPLADSHVPASPGAGRLRRTTPPSSTATTTPFICRMRDPPGVRGQFDARTDRRPAPTSKKFSAEPRGHELLSTTRSGSTLLLVEEPPLEPSKPRNVVLLATRCTLPTSHRLGSRQSRARRLHRALPCFAEGRRRVPPPRRVRARAQARPRVPRRLRSPRVVRARRRLVGHTRPPPLRLQPVTRSKRLTTKSSAATRCSPAYDAWEAGERVKGNGKREGRLYSCRRLALLPTSLFTLLPLLSSTSAGAGVPARRG